MFIATSVASNFKKNDLTGRSKIGIRRSPIALALAGIFGSGVVLAAANTIAPINSTTSVTQVGDTTDIRTSLVINGTGINAFTTFIVDSGQLVNLRIPDAASAKQLLNLVNDKIIVNGTVNSLINNEVGGKLIFASPNGMIVGSAGVLNVGSLVVRVPNQTSFDNAGTDATGSGAMADLIAGNGAYRRNDAGLIQIDGKIFAPGGITLDANTVNVSATGKLVAADPGALQDSVNAAVNPGPNIATGLQSVNGVIEIVGATISIGDSGRVMQPGVYDNGSLRGFNVTLTAPSITLNSASQVLAQEKNSVSTAYGAVTLLAESEQKFDSVSETLSHIKAEAKANISIDGKIEAGKIDVQAKATAIYDWQEKLGVKELAGSDGKADTFKDSLLKGAIGTVATALTGTNIGVAKVDGRASITIGSHADLKANTSGTDGGVLIKAETTAELSLTKRAQAPVSANPLFSLAFVYADNEAHSTVTIEEGAKIDSKGKVDILAQTSALLNVSVTAISNESVAVLAGALTSADIEAKVDVQKGVTISADENVTIKATNLSKKLNTEALSIGIEASGSTAASLLGAAVAYTELNTAATVSSGAQITSKDSVSVTAKNDIEQNTLTAKSQLVKELSKLAMAKLAVSDSAALVGVLGGSVFSGLVKKMTLNLPGSSETRPSAAGALAYGENQHAATVQIADSAVGDIQRSKIDAANAVYINAALIDAKPVTSAGAEVAAMPPKDGKAVGVAAAVAMNNYEHVAQAVVGKNAELSGRAVNVHAKIDMVNPNLAAFSEFFGDLISSPKDTVQDIAKIITYPNGQTSSSSKAAANTTAVNGSVSWINFDDNSNAKIDSGTQIHLKDGAPAALFEIDKNDILQNIVLTNGVAVTSDIAVKQVFASGLVPGMGASSGEGSAKSLGGNINYVAHGNHSSAVIADGVSINQPVTQTDGSVTTAAAAKEVQVTSNNDVSLSVLTWASGSGGAFGANLMFAMTDFDESSYAIIDRSANIIANKVTVDATEKLHDYTVAGTYSNAKETGVALSVAVTSVKTDTVAAVTTTVTTNAQPDYSAPQGQITASEVMVAARTEGEIWAGSLAAAVSENDKAPAWKPPEPETTPDTSSLGKVTAKSKKLPGKSKTPAVSAAVPESYKPDFGLSISGSSSVNDVQMGTRAYLDGAHVVAPAVGTSILNVQAVNAARIGAVSGGVSKTKTTNAGAEGSAAVAGAFAYNDIENVTDASIHSANHLASELADQRSVLSNFHEVGVTALAGGEQFALALGVGANSSGGTGTAQQNSSGVAGSAAASVVKNTVSAVVSYATITNDDAAASGNNLHIRALDDIFLATGAGGLTSGSSKSVGGAFTYSEIKDTVTASLDHASVENYQGIAVNALTSSSIYAAALGAAGSTSNGGGSGLAASGSVVVNTIKNSVTADVKNSTINSTTNGHLDVSAGDTVDPNLKFTDLIAAPASTSGVDYSGASSGVDGDDATKPKVSDSIKGAGSSIVTVAGSLSIATGSDASSAGSLIVAYNDIKNTFSASVENSKVDMHAGSVDVKAASNAYILDVAAGVATTTGTGKFAAAGVIAVNEITNTIHASVSGSSAGKTTIDADKVTVSARDSSHIDTATGALAVSTKSNAVGGAIAYSAISNVTEAWIDTAILGATSSPETEVLANNTSGIRTITVAAGVGKENAVGIVTAVAEISNTTTASLKNVSQTGSGINPNQDAAVTVKATDNAAIQTIAVEVAAAGNAAVGGVIAVNLIDNTTDAVVSGGQLAVTDVVVDAQSAGKVQIIAVGLGVSKGNVGIAGSVITNEINSDTSAKIKDGARINATNNVLVNAESDDHIDLAAGAFGASKGVGIGASVVVNGITTSTVAAIEGTNTVVTAQAKGNTLVINSGGFDDFGSVNSADSINAYHDLDLKAKKAKASIKGVAVNATATEYIESISVNAGVGKDAAVAANININHINGGGASGLKGTLAYIADATVTSGVTGDASRVGDIDVRAGNLSVASGFSGALAISTGGVGVGVGFDGALMQRDTKAYISGAQISADNALRVDANAVQAVSSLAAVGAVGGKVGVGLTGSLIQFDATTEAFIQGGRVTAHQLDVDANSVSKAFSFAGMLAGGGVGAGGGALALVTSDNATKAYIAGTATDKIDVSVDGAVNVDAQSALRVDGYAIGAALSGQSAFAGSVAATMLSDTTQSTINNAIVGTDAAKVGSLNVAAHNSTEIHSNAGALAIGVGTAGAGAAIVFNNLNNTTSANIIDSAVVATGAVSADAGSTNQVDSYSIAGGGGLYVGFGAGVNVTLIGGKAGSSEGDKSQSAVNYVNEIDLAGLPANLGFSVNTAPVVAPSSLAYKTAAGISGTSTVKASAVNVLSEDSTRTYSMAGGVGVGLLGVGASVTVVKTDATVESIVGPAVSLISGDITVTAIAKDKDGKHTIEVDSWAGAGGGFALGGAVSYGEITNHVTAQLAGTVNASGAAVVTADDSSSIHLSSYGAAIGVSAAAATIFSFGEKDSTVIAQLNPDLSGKSDASMSVGSMAVTGKKSGKVEARAIGGAVGGIGLTVTLSQAKDDSSVLAKLNDNLHLASGELSVKTDSNSSLTTNTVAGAAGYFAGSAAVAISNDGGSSTVQVGSAVVIEATDVIFKAQHQSEFKNTADASQISLAGGSGAAAKGNVNTTTSVSVGDDVEIKATSITILARNEVTEYINDGGNANGISGGLAAGAGMSSKNTINTTSNVTTGDRSKLTTADLVLSNGVIGAGAIKLEASSRIFAADRSNVSVGGLISGANSESTIEASTHNSVTVGAEAQIHSGNAIDIGTYDDIQISTGAYAHGYGLAGAVAGTARSVIVTDQNIEVKKDARLFAWDDIRIATGRDANGIAQDSLRASADTQVYFDGAFNGTKPRAEAYITSNAKAIINAGASLESVRNILLGNLAGYSDVSASGDGHYTILGIPKKNHSADSSANHDHQFTMNGSAEAGVRHDVRFDVDVNGNVTQSYAPGVTKMTYLENSAYPLIAKIETKIALLNARLASETGSARIDTQNEIDTLTTLRNLQQTNIGGAGTVAIMELDANMAAGGNINVFSDLVKGNGSLTAHGGPSIQINNASTKYLLLNSLLIPDELGGNIDFHGATRSAAGGTLRTDVTLPNVAGTIAINNTADVGAGPTPGIIMQGRIDNEGGALNVYNESGDVVQYAPVRVYRQSISAPNGTVLIDTPATGVSVNGLVEKYWTQSGGALFDLSTAAGSFGGGVSLPGGSKPTDKQGTYTGAIGFDKGGAGGTPGSADEAVMYAANAWAKANGYPQWLASKGKVDSDLNRSMWLAGLNPDTAGEANNHNNDLDRHGRMFFASGMGFNGVENSGGGYTSVYGGDYGVGNNRFYVPNIPLRVLSHQIAAYSPQNAAGASSAEPAIKAGNAVIVNARYIDVNGTISAGRPVEVATQIDQKYITVGSIFSTKSINLLDCLSDVVCRNSHAETARLYDSKTGWYQYQDTDDAAKKAGKVAVYFDPLSKQLVTGTIKAGGAGSITLIGQIINTNGGPNRSKLSVSNGFANVTVNNTTGKGINLGNISTGSSDDQVGVIQITDTNKINNGQVPTTWYVNTPGGSMATYTSTTARDYKAATLQSTSAAGTAAIYTPDEGSRYQWTHTANLAREFDPNVKLSSWHWVDSASPYALDGVWDISASVIKDRSLSNIAFKQDISGGITSYGYYYVSVVSGNGFQKNYDVVTGVNIKSVSSAKADYGIDIEFKGNNPTGKINVNSNASINVGGRLNNENGLTSLNATGAGARIDQTGLGEVNTLSLDLKAVAGIGQVNSPFKVNLDTNPVRLATPSTISAQTASGDIALDVRGVRDTTLGQVATDAGSDVVIHSQGSLLANSANPVNVTGRNITLTSEQGSIGDSAHALTINTQASAVSGGGITGGLLQANARSDIALTQVKGDLYVDEVISANGNVKLMALSGSLLDGKNATTVDKGDAIVDQWTKIFVPHFNDVITGEENGNRAAYKRYLGLLEIGDFVDSVFVLKTDKLGGYQSGVRDGQTLNTAQIQETANTQFQTLVQYLDSALVTGWQQKKEETISFSASVDKIASLTRGQNWSSDDLKYQINSAALTASTVAVPYINISGNRVELVSQAANVGNVNPAVEFDFSNGKITYSAEQKAAILGANSAGDMIVYSKDSNNNPLHFGLKQTRDLKVEVKQALLVNAARDVFILAKDTLPVEQVVAGGDVRLTSGAGMRNVGGDGTVAITAQNLDLQGGSGSIGAAGKAMTIKAGLLNSARAGTSTTGDVYLKALTGDINYLSLFAGNVLSLEVADGNLLTSNLDKSLSANTLLLHVRGDVRGAGAGQAIAMDLGHGSQTGTVTGSVGGSAVLVNAQALNLDALTVAGAARIENSAGNMTVSQLDVGSLTLTSSGLILGQAGAVSADIHSSGNVSLTADGLGTSTDRLLVSAATFDANVSNSDAWLTFMAGNGVTGTTLTSFILNDAHLDVLTQLNLNVNDIHTTSFAHSKKNITLSADHAGMTLGKVSASGNLALHSLAGNIAFSQLSAEDISTSIDGKLSGKAGGELNAKTLNAAATSMDLATVKVAQLAKMTASADVAVGLLDVGSLDLAADNVAITQLLSQGEATIHGKDHVSLSSVTVGSVSNPADLTVLADTGMLTIGSASVAQDASLTAASMSLGTVTAARNLSLRATAGDAFFSGTLDVGSSINAVVQGALAGGAGSIMRAPDLDVMAGRTDLDVVRVSRNANLMTNANGVLGVHDLQVGTLVLNAFEDASLGQVNVADTTTLIVVRDLQVGKLDSLQQVDVKVGRDAQFDTVLIEKAGLNVAVGRDMQIATLLDSAGTVNIDIGRDGTFKTVRVDETNPNVDLNVTAGGELTLEKDGTASRTYLKAGGGLSLSVSGAVEGASTVLSAKRIAVTAKSIDLLGLEAGESIKLTARDGSVKLDFVNQGLNANSSGNGIVDIKATGDIAIREIHSRGTAVLQSGTSIDVAALVTSKDARIVANDYVTLGSVVVGDVNNAANLTVVANTGSLKVASAAVSQDASLSAAGIELGTVIAGRDLSLAATKGDLAFSGLLQAGEKLSATVAGGLNGTAASAIDSGTLNVSANSMELANIKVAQLASLTANADIHVQLLNAGSLDVTAQNLTLDTTVSLGSANIHAMRDAILGSLVVGDATHASDLLVTADTGALTMTSAAVSQDASLSAAGIELGTVIAGRDLSLAATKGDLAFSGLLQAGEKLSATVAGGLNGAKGSTVHAGSLAAAASAIRLDQVNVTRNAQVSASVGDIAMDRILAGSMNVSALSGNVNLATVVSNGDVNINAGRGVSLTHIEVGDTAQASDLKVSARNGQIRILDLANISRDAQLDADTIDANVLKAGRNVQMSATTGVRGNQLFAGHNGVVQAGDFIDLAGMTTLADTTLTTLRVPFSGTSGISVNTLRTSNLHAQTPGALILNDAMIGKTAVLRAAKAKANLTHTGAAALDLDVTGNPGILAQAVDLKIDSVSGINFKNLKANVATITTNSVNNIIQTGLITGQLSFVSPKGELWMNNINTASVAGKLLQMYAAYSVFSMTQKADYFTTNAYVTYFDALARPTVNNYSTVRDVESLLVAGVSAERDLNRVPLGIATEDNRIAEERRFASDAVWVAWSDNKFAPPEINKMIGETASAAGNTKAEEKQWNALIEESVTADVISACLRAKGDAGPSACSVL
jgi:hypothetical protein